MPSSLTAYAAGQLWLKVMHDPLAVGATSGSVRKTQYLATPSRLVSFLPGSSGGTAACVAAKASW